jgi:hypothetical protein
MKKPVAEAAGADFARINKRLARILAPASNPPRNPDPWGYQSDFTKR